MRQLFQKISIVSFAVLAPMWFYQVRIPGPGGENLTPPATPGFVGETSKNSTLTNALGTNTGGQTACSDYSYCLPYPEPSLAGNLGVVSFQYSNATSVTVTVTDDQSDSYDCLPAGQVGSTGFWVQTCFAQNMAAGAHRVTITFGTTAVTQVMAKASMFYNISTTSALDIATTASGASSTTVNAGNLTTHAANDLIYVYVVRVSVPSTTSFTSGGSDYTLGTTDIHDGSASEFGVIAASGSVTPTMTMGTASTYGESVVAFYSANAGTAPSGMYVDRLESWSSPIGQTTTSWPFQLPSSGNLLVNTDSCGGTGPMAPVSITDTTNTWTLAGVNTLGSEARIGELYSQNAVSNSSGGLTVTTAGTGDCTFTFYSIKNAPVTTFTNRSEYQGSASSGTVMPITTSWLPWATSGLTIVVGGQETDTSVSMNSPSSGCPWDGASYGGMNINGPEPIDENNQWAHCYIGSLGPITVSINQAASMTPNGWDTDLLSFLAPGGIGVVNTANCQTTSSATLSCTISKPTSGNALVAAIGHYKSTTLTIGKVCLDGTTCAAGNAFSQVSGSVAAGNSSEAGTEDWVLLSAPSTSSTTLTITTTSSVSATNLEVFYWEVAKASGGTWSTDVSGNVANGSVASGVANGPSLTTTGTAEFCAGNFGVSNSVSPNPASGNEFVYPGVIFTGTNDAANSLLTTTAGVHKSAVGDPGGTFNASTTCLN